MDIVYPSFALWLARKCSGWLRRFTRLSTVSPMKTIYHLRSLLRGALASGGLLRRLAEYLVFALVLFALTSQFWDWGGLQPLSWHKALELPLVLYFYFLFRSFLPASRWRALLAAIPVLLVYLFLDVYYLLLGRVFRLSELQELPELIDVLPWTQSVMIAALLGLPLLLLLSRLRWPGWRRALLSLLPLVALVVVIQWRPGWFLQSFVTVANPPVVWSDYRSVGANGRLSMVLYQAARRQQALQSLAAYRDEAGYQAEDQRRMTQLREIDHRRNVHIVVLEGFLDPLRLENLRFNIDPVHPDFRKLLIAGTGNLSRSPVYGGYTAQAEFEVLCGVPAQQEFGTIEFNLFSGARIHCLPDALRRIGYQSVATEGFKPEFFNARAALKGVGFEAVHFPREYAPADNSYLSTGDVDVEQYMFDAVMLRQNREFIRQRLGAGPLLNYVMTIYGHIPFVLDEQLRPRIIKVVEGGPVNDDLLAIVNQIYYRSKAIAEHINALKEMDPDSIVIVLGDHVPPMPEGKRVYEQLGYLAGREDSSKLTLLAVFDRGKPLSLTDFHHYDVPALVYRLLLDGRYCETQSCQPRSAQTLKRQYRRLMAHAVGESEG